jgi:hypothetical protein
MSKNKMSNIILITTSFLLLVFTGFLALFFIPLSIYEYHLPVFSSANIALFLMFFLSLLFFVFSIFLATRKKNGFKRGGNELSITLYIIGTAILIYNIILFLTRHALTENKGGQTNLVLAFILFVFLITLGCRLKNKE